MPPKRNSRKEENRQNEGTVEPQKTLSQRWNELKPERPHKPGGKFAHFVSAYSQLNREEQKIEEGEKRNFIAIASQAWKQLDDHERNFFERPEAMQKYKEEVQQYKLTTQAMKRPAQSYSLFLQHYWQTKKPKCEGKKDFARIQKAISREWKNSPESTKALYKAASNLSKDLFRKEQESVLNEKREMNLNWKVEGCHQISQLLNKGINKEVCSSSGCDEEALEERVSSSSIFPHRRSARLLAKKGKEQEKKPSLPEQQEDSSDSDDSDDDYEVCDDEVKGDDETDKEEEEIEWATTGRSFP